MRRQGHAHDRPAARDRTVLAAADDHPDVEELYRRCAKVDDRISISTVYRTVKLFEDAGIIERHDFREGRARYEQIPDTHHDHLINLRTGEVIEFRSGGDRAPAGRDGAAAGLQAGRSSPRALRGTARRQSQTVMLRVALVAAAVAAITITLMPLQWLSLRLRLPTRRAIPVAYHRTMCALLGVRVRVAGERLRQHPLLIVANHVSWLDICVLTALAPVVFVAKREVASLPLFGLLARLQRSVFVDRERRLPTAATNAEIAARLADGDPVVLFAEGTSSDGNRVLPFRSSLIGAAHAVLANGPPPMAGRVGLDPAAFDCLCGARRAAARAHRIAHASHGMATSTCCRTSPE